MADPEHDKDVSGRYRELGRDEPPPELDAKIRAEARRAVTAHPAPLVVPTGRRSWYFPVAAAAVIVLAVAVTWQMEREEADTFAVSQQAASEPEVLARSKEEAKPPQKIAPLAKRAEKPAATPPFTPEPPAAAQAPAESTTGTLSLPRDREAYGSRGDRARQERPSAATEAEKRALESLTLGGHPISGAAPGPAPQADAVPQARPAPQAAPLPAPKAEAGARVRAQVEPRPLAGLGLEAPVPWLERIAQLRRDGKHDEADKALAEFRKRYPDYKIPDAMLEKVEKK